MITVVCIARARTATEETFKWAMQRKALMLSSAHVRVVVGLLTIPNWLRGYKWNHPKPPKKLPENSFHDPRFDLGTFRPVLLLAMASMT